MKRFLLAALCLFLPAVLHATISANAVWEVRLTGSDTNGGGYDSSITGAGTDYSQQDSPQVAFNGVTNILSTTGASTTTLVSNNAVFTSAMIGNSIQITGGTNFTTGNYFITAFQSSTKVTLDRTPSSAGAGSAGTGNLGGALQSPAKATSFIVSGNTIYVKYNTSVYPITSASTNISSGCISFVAGIAGQPTRMIGYDTTRSPFNTDTNQPTFQASSGLSSPTLLQGNVNEVEIQNIIADCNSATLGTSFGSGSSGFHFFRDEAVNCKNTGFRTNSNGMAELCIASNCVTGYASNCDYACVAIGGSQTITCINGFIDAFGEAMFINCWTINCPSASGFNFNGALFVTLINCGAYNVSTGFNNAGSASISDYRFINCIAALCSSYGFGAGAATSSWHLFNCAGYSNSSGNVNPNIASYNNLNFQALTQDPFNNESNLDFSLNSLPNGGGQLKNAGLPEAKSPWSLPGLNTPSYPDIGPVQHSGAAAFTYAQ